MNLAAELTSTCTCENEDGTPSEDCYGCFEDSKALVEELIVGWAQQNEIEPDDFLFISGTGLGWTRANGFTIKRAKEVIDALSLNGDYRLDFTLVGKEMKAIRYSHDEPTGASFEFREATEQEVEDWT